MMYTDNDILCGKSKTCIHHPGSIRFRNLIDAYGPKYQQALTKYDKMSITRKIYESVIQTSRFLKYNEEDDTWEEISSEAARDKIGHSLRFACRATKRRTTKGHKRTGSETSVTSNNTESTSTSTTTSSSSYRQDSILRLFSYPMAPMPVVSSLCPAPTSLTISANDFLDSQFNFDEQDRSTDDLMHLLQDEQELEVDDILKVVRNLDFSESEQPEESNLLSLLNAPVGDF